MMQKILIVEDDADISHDLRTPLTSILGYLKLLDVQALSPEDRESFLIVERKSGYLQRLISQFYDLSQLLSGDFEPEIKCVDAGHMLRGEEKKLVFLLKIPTASQQEGSGGG